MKKINFTSKVIVLFTLLASAWSVSDAQTNYQSISNGAGNPGGGYYYSTNDDGSGRPSDYKIYVGSGTLGGNYDCWQDWNQILVGTGYNNAAYISDQQSCYSTGGGGSYYTSTYDPIVLGPSASLTFYITLWQEVENHYLLDACATATSSSNYQNGIGWMTNNTAAIYPPGSISSSIVNVTNIPSLEFSKISWTKGSDIPDSYLQYQIFRGSLLLATLPATGSSMSYIDSTLLSSGSYTYYVETTTSSWGGHTSSPASVAVSITNNVLTASNGTYYSKTHLTWPNIAIFSPNGIQVLSNGQQLAVLNKNATTYDDFDGVPGVTYQYSVAPIDINNNTPFTFSANGFSKPNGVLSGYVRSILGSGVPSVLMTATGTVDGVPYTYSDTTDGTGFYKLKDIFYDTTATYTVVPSRGNDLFDPTSVTRTLDIQDYNISMPQIDDTTVFTVQGYVYATPYLGSVCGMAGAQLYVNGHNMNIMTDASGHYQFTANTIGTYDISFKYYDHVFDHTSQSIFVADNTNTSVNFTDTKMDTLVLDLKSGCNSQLCDYATFTIQSYPNGCVSLTKHFDGWDKDTLILPAIKYNVSLPNSVYINGFSSPTISTSGPYGQMQTMDVDLTHRDTSYLTQLDTTYHYTAAIHRTLADGTVISVPADTTIAGIDTISTPTVPYRTAFFQFHFPIVIELDNLPAKCTSTNEYLVNENQPYRLEIRVKEQAVYGTDTNYCYVDTGTIQIYDNVSGNGMSVGQLVHGKLYYVLIPGQPNVPDNSTNHQYEKLFNLFTSAGSQPANLDAWTLIQGQRTLTPTFNTTPSMPLMVLHDPPGSASFSSLEKDSSVSFNTQILANTTFSAGAQAQVMIGTVEDVPILGIQIPGPYGNFQIQGTGGFSRDSNSSYTMTFTAAQTISTSSDPNYVGFNGDVFIGAAMNMKYSKAYQLTVDNNCVASVDTVLSYGIDSVSTEFIYSVYDLKHTILPNLYNLLTIAPASPDSIYNKAYFQNQINVWNQALTNDSAAIANFTPTRNISFTAGTSYDYSASSDTNYQSTYNYAITGSLNQSLVFGISDGNNVNVNAGEVLSFNTSHATDKSGTTDNNTVYSYHLEDDVAGNYYSVNIGSDKNYGSPVFNIFAGASACPWEVGTQPRDEPEMTIDPVEIYNVPANALASFVATLGNHSESSERRTYVASVSPESNPNGAIITMGGQNITQTPASFTLGDGDELPVTLTVQKGPFAADYDNIGINFGSSCDTNINVLINISVHFQNNCSDISILQPSDNWLVNASNHDTLRVQLAGYDQSNPGLQQIGLQYRLVGTSGTTNNLSSWSIQPQDAIDSANITAVATNMVLDATHLADGNYEIQAFAHCGTGAGSVYTYSAPLSGVIDRSGFSLYGTPTPANGILNLTDNIGLQFNENIDCNQTYERMQVKLTRADNGLQIADSFSCYGNGLIITTNPISLLDSLDGVTLIASVDKVHDANGNGMTSPITWSFVVNRSKVYWSPSNANVTTTKGSSTTVTATMTNVGLPDSFTLVKVPTWLTTSQVGPYHLAQGTSSPSTFALTFTVSSSLNQGHYTDTVIATADGKRMFFYVTLDVVVPAPNWTVNPANFQYSMNITTNYSTTQLNTPLSSDMRDEIAVFVGNQCRGVAHISYDAGSNSYSAFITAYSNRAIGDTFSFRMWDALPGIEYQAKEHLPFITDGVIGQPLAPYILHAGGIFQTIPFNAGWTWFSLNVTATDMSPANVLSSITGNSGAVVKTQNEYAQYTSGGWAGTLAAFSTNNSYMIQLDHPDTLHFLGQLAADTALVQIASGWNWIGFPRLNIVSDTTFLKSANSTAGDIIKSESLFALYTSTGWAGSLHNMSPGQGYKWKTANAFNFVIPPDRSLPVWSVAENQYEQNECVTADLQFDGVSTRQSHYLVGAFVGSTCVGTAQPEFLAAQNMYRVFMTIHGDTANAGQAVTFKVYDTDNDIEFTPTYSPISVTPDSNVAKVEAAYPINVQTTTGINALTYTEGYSLMQNVPNPFAKTTSIQYTVPSAQQMTLTIYDESGRLVRELVNGTQAAGTHTVSFEQDNLQSGVYFYQMKSGNFVKTRRMLIIQ